MKKIISIIINLSIIIAGGSVMVYSFFSWQGTVLALSNDYNKSDAAAPPDNEITATEWNTLLADFVNQNGDTMAGNLDMNGRRITALADPANGGDLANRQWTANRIAGAYMTFSAGAQDRDGNPLYIVCGRSGSTWGLSGGNLVIDVDTTGPAAGTGDPIFSGTPFYLVNVGGDDRNFEPRGQSSFYLASNTGFRVFLYQGDVSPNITAAEANSLGWHVNWCGIGTIL